ncbi:hypothetical protein CBR_g67396 [Chara braunii]|uniref:CCHC-type domain-containing protein n=1 Tax=Chara braunii TaxID=69332 RepID=A0A388MFX0_CHABU|nr:hypothetical protein CBR_g67396 [Chara braunii]|eukprot:GBG93375.1 hypothetical protein CBR_g67396 [Chara braunii]
MYTDGGNNGGNMDTGGMGGNGNNGNWGGRHGGPICYECGKTGHIARDCWSKRGKLVPQDDEIHIFVRDLMKDKEEKRKREEEEERQRAKEEKERKKELDMARRTEEIRMQLQAEIAEKWRRQQEEAAEKARETKTEMKCTSPKISLASKTAMKTKERKKKMKKPTKKKKGKKRILVSSSESGEESSESTSEVSSDTKEEALRLVKVLRERKQKVKSRRRQTKKKGSRRTPTRTYGKGEMSKKSTTPISPTRTGGLESRTPLSAGYKGISAGCSQEGFVDYTFAVMKQYSTKNVPNLKEICDKYGIKATRKDEMVMELVKRQTKVAYDGFFTTPVGKKTMLLKIGQDGDEDGKTPIEVVKTTITTRGKTRQGDTPRVTLRSAPTQEADQHSS